MKKFLLLLSMAIIIVSADIVPVFAQATFETGSMAVTVNAYGRIRAYLPDTNGTKHIERISPLVGISSDAVFDYQNDMEVEEPTSLIITPPLSDFELVGAYNNAYSAEPPNVLVRYNIYSWNNAKYALVKWTITNRENSAINAKIGLDIIMSLDGTYGYDTVTYNPSNQVIITKRGGVISGIKFFSHPLQSLYSFEWYDGYTADSSYWTWLNYGSIQNEYIGDVEGPVTIPSIDFININSQDSVVLYFAFALGENESDLIAQISDAQAKYNLITDVNDEFLSSPVDFSLNQNYPNPFNPSTVISWNV
ncbi:MAG: hypothetical protein ACUVT3_09580, partial [Ignavibacterium sp.]